MGIPEDGIGVEIWCWVKPEVELLLSVSFTFSNYIGVNSVRITTQIP